MMLIIHDAQARRFRAQQHAPPKQMPPDTVSIFTDGSAVPRKLGQPPAPAGYGFVAVAGGTNHRKGEGRVLTERSGQITVGHTRNVRTTTNNVAELVAFTRALQWVRGEWRTRRKPVCMRYDSTYAAMISSGVWKAKKHKELAQEARAAWLALKRDIGERLWMRHAKGHSGHISHYFNDRADKLRSSRCGESRP